MKIIKILIIISTCVYSCSCVTWVREETNDKITKGMVGAIIETKEDSKICYSNNPRRFNFDTNYFIVSANQKNLPENCYIIEQCPSGTRGRVVKFFKERDASQHIWNYVEFEMNDPTLKQNYRIIRMAGLRGNSEGWPWSVGGDFRIVRNE